MQVQIKIQTVFHRHISPPRDNGKPVMLNRRGTNPVLVSQWGPNLFQMLQPLVNAIFIWGWKKAKLVNTRR